jgi:hypothetical protein
MAAYFERDTVSLPGIAKYFRVSALGAGAGVWSLGVLAPPLVWATVGVRLVPSVFALAQDTHSSRVQALNVRAWSDANRMMRFQNMCVCARVVVCLLGGGGAPALL